MNKRLLTMALVPLFIINVAALATFSYKRWHNSQPAEKSEGESGTWKELQGRMLLRPQQMEEMQDYRRSFERDIASLRQRIREKRSALIDETRKASPDLNRIDGIIEEIGVLQTLVQKKTIRNLLKDKEILTPLQEETYFSLFENHVRGRGMRYRRGGRGRGRNRRLEGSQREDTIYR